MKLFGSKLSLSMAAAVLMAAPRIAHACAMCGLPPGDHAIHAFNTSVLFMLLSPYVVFGTIGGMFYAGYRSAMKKRRAGADNS